MRTCAFVIFALVAFGNVTITCRLKPSIKPFSVLEFLAPLQERPYALLVSAAFVGYLGLFIPFSFIVVQAAAVGMDPQLQGYLVPILNGASFFGRTIPGHIADKIGRFNVTIVMCMFSATCVLAVWIPATTSSNVLAFAALYGFGSGAYISIMPTLVAEVTKDMSKLGVRNGTMFAIISISTLIGSPIAGALIKAGKGQFWGLQVFTGLALAMSSLLIVLTRASLVGWNIKVKA